MATQSINGVCRETVRRTLNIFHGTDSTIEIRILGVDGRKTRTDAGYFNNVDAAADAVHSHAQNFRSKGIYFALNPAFSSLLSRAKNRIQQFATTLTSDNDILLRRWLYLDFDPVRPAEISSTDGEHNAAIERANQVADWLKEQGFPDPVFADSGNGVHLHFPINVPHNSESTTLVKAVTAEIARRFSDNVVTIDEAVFNASRICRAYGTTACKGDDTEERPHRRSSLIYVPDYLSDGWSEADAADPGLLEQLAAMAPKASDIPPKSSGTNGHHFTGETIDLKRLLTDRGIEFRQDEGNAKFPVKLHVQCPFNDSHIGKDAYVAQAASGALLFKCSHTSCVHNDWQAFKRETGIQTSNGRTGQNGNAFTNGVGVGGLNAGKQRPTADRADDFQPFPVQELPEPLARFCNEVADAVGCDSSFPALVALSVCSAAIGTSRQIRLKGGWYAVAILWGLLVGESGTQKSPPFRLAMAPLKARQQRDVEAFIAMNARYQADLKAYKRDAKQWERKQEGDEPEAPERPTRPRCVVADSTIEGLASILNENPRGVLLARDELSGWLAGFDQYRAKSSASSEVPKWLEIYNCESITIDRKTGDERFLFVRRPSVNIAGGIQPGILARVLTNEHKENGLQSRLLMTFPPRQAKQWRDSEVSSATQAAYADLIRDLFELQPDTSGGESKPATLTLSDGARRCFKDYVNTTGAEQSAMHGHLASQWSKLEETPARLAIILHCVQQVTSGVVSHWQVDEQTMQSAIVLAEWFKTETLRIGRLLKEPDETRKTRHLASWIHSHGGTMTARDLCKYRRDIATSDDAERLLMGLVEAGFGSWRGIHRSREFVLNEPTVSADGA